MPQSMPQFLRPEDYLFHRSPMLLIERIHDISAESVCCSTDLDSPLLQPFSVDHQLPAYFGIELMAQTVGVWAGHQDLQAGRDKAQGGLILSVRSYQPAHPSFQVAPGPLNITMQMLMQNDNFASFEGSIQHGGQTLATGRLSLCQLNDQLAHELGLSTH